MSMMNPDEKNAALTASLFKSGSLPHALLIEAQDKKAAADAAELISMFAVCKSEHRPCKVCPQCQKAEKHAHPDISYPQPENKKSGTYSIDQMRLLAADASIIPNEADAKVYVFEDADERFTPIVQNSFLKLLEEPPKNVHFIMLCENAQKLLITIRSRCTLLRLSGSAKTDPQSAEHAEKIAEGIISAREYDLLLSLRALSDKEHQTEVISALKQLLSDALALLSGAERPGCTRTAELLSAKFTRKKLLDMLELCDSSLQKLKQNGNINLITAQMCGEFRRISWQR